MFRNEQYELWYFFDHFQDILTLYSFQVLQNVSIKAIHNYYFSINTHTFYQVYKNQQKIFETKLAEYQSQIQEFKEKFENERIAHQKSENLLKMGESQMERFVIKKRQFDTEKEQFDIEKEQFETEKKKLLEKQPTESDLKPKLEGVKFSTL